MKNKSLNSYQALVWPRAIEVLVVLALFAAVGLSFNFVKQKQSQIHDRQMQIEAAPQQRLRIEAATMNFEKYEDTITQLQALVVPRASIGTFVNEVERYARANQVQVRVPDIQEQPKLGPDNKPIPPAGPFTDIRLQVQAAGEPVQLLQFLHAVEHLPYVVVAPAWSLSTTNQALASSFSLNVPPEAPRDVPVTPPGFLEATLILTIAQ